MHHGTSDAENGRSHPTFDVATMRQRSIGGTNQLGQSVEGGCPQVPRDLFSLQPEPAQWLLRFTQAKRSARGDNKRNRSNEEQAFDQYGCAIGGSCLGVSPKHARRRRATRRCSPTITIRSGQRDPARAGHERAIAATHARREAGPEAGPIAARTEGGDHWPSAPESARAGDAAGSRQAGSIL